VNNGETNLIDKQGRGVTQDIKKIERGKDGGSGGKTGDHLDLGI